MPVVQGIQSEVNCNISGGVKESKTRNTRWDNKEKIFQAAGKIRGGRLKSFYWKMFGTANNSSVRARKNNLKAVSKNMGTKNPIFRIGESDKFYGFPAGQIKEIWFV